MSENPELVPTQFGLSDVDVIERKTLYRGFYYAEKVTLRHRLFRDNQWCEPLTRELIHHKQAVGVLLYDPALDQVALVEQFRIGAMAEATGPWLLEVVAGMVEAGETPQEVARRELVEEAGIEQVELHYIGNYLATPGGCDEKLYLYCGLCDLSGGGGLFGLAEENEDIKMHVLAADEVFAQLYTGRWNNPAALITLQWLQYNRDSLTQSCEG
ncbi:NUDIX domain-containing protein [Gilvimarinus agarilyticus]|uniref:NUDIX domain-containing protein n=1 Tax=unclassified Gilvimarinus TaxID=2642066 RepID=UPI001C08CB82|nr:MULTISPECIES: NUDIX domain-containing protein [unclassified Gilvimarinus]MBU2887655.1 NUDIX domain-containing protein [Gilvimarinus agarilyticus]MDO6572304.1 NUDIX domain-containing protein [Gilvimarinus sp. 2_MG-2023]MDO6746476.1 NUDIX domain-containing protein [Gilvimarinus sp. 1_MG-2023]